MNLMNAQIGAEYRITKMETGDQELNAFLFRLGCYPGEPVTVLARRWGSCTVAVKDGKYSMDVQLAKAIAIQ